MAKFKFIYIDDEPPEVVASFVKAIEGNSGLRDQIDIDHQSPLVWNEQIKHIQSSKFDGLILDLRLDVKKMWGTEKKETTAHFRAEELAQKIRVLATEGKVQDTPIVLWSTDSKLNNSGFRRDSTPKDLFDFKIIKNNISKGENSQDYFNKLIALAKGYITIRKNMPDRKVNIAKILSFPHEDYILDPRINLHFDGIVDIPVHDVARFILEDIIGKPGILVTDNLLAIRLGVDPSKSTEWSKFKNEILRHYKYNGVFSEGWIRYYWDDVNDWWKHNFGRSNNLKLLSASKRVEMLKEKFPDYSLWPLTPNKDNTQGKFWYECIVTKKAIEHEGGLIVSSSHRTGWSENEYISFNALRRRLDKKLRIVIDPLESFRLEKFKAKENE